MDPNHPPVLVVTDLYMPGIDGWRFCRLLRSPEYGAFNRVPILVVSATFAGEEPSRITADLKANAFVPSPVNGERFIDSVKSILSGDKPREMLRALIVEDSNTLAGLLGRFFEKNGYRVSISLNAESAAMAFGKESFDVAVIDYHLPDGQGDELLAQFQSTQPDCVFIMMTTDHDPELALNWIRQGAAAYLRKPFEPEHLVELCARARREKALLRVEDQLEVRTRELRENQARLAENNQILEGVLEHTHMMAAYLDPQFNFVWVNRAYAETCGREPSFFPGKNHFDLYPHEENQAIFSRVVETGAPFFVKAKPFEFPDPPERGVTYWDWSLIPVKDGIGKVTGLVFTLAEVTDRIRAEESLRHEREQLLSIFDSIDESIYVSDPYSYEILYVNKAMRDVFQKDPVGGICYREFQGLEAPCAFCTNEIILEKKPLPHRWEHSNPKLNKEFTIVDRIIKWPDGRDVRFELAIDITEHKRSEEHQKRLTSAIEQSAEAFIITDPDATIQYVNPAFERITGYTREEAVGRNPRILKSGEQGEAFYKEMWDTLLRGETWNGRLVNKKKDGTLYTEEAVVSPVCDDSGRAVNYVATKWDVTEALHVENQLRQAQKVESIGRLAGGVAHDLNNLLSPVIGYSELLRDDLNPDDVRRQSLDEILNAGLRARDLVRQLLAFSRSQTLEFKALDMNKIVTGFENLLRRTPS